MYFSFSFFFLWLNFNFKEFLTGKKLFFVAITVLLSSALIANWPAMIFPPPLRSMSVHRGKTHLPFCTGPYSVGSADLADSGVFLRLFYPHRKHQNNAEKKEFLLENVHRWTRWFPEPEYASAYLGLGLISGKIWEIFLMHETKYLSFYWNVICNLIFRKLN